MGVFVRQSNSPSVKFGPICYYVDDNKLIRKSNAPNDKYGEIVYYVDSNSFVRKANSPNDKYGEIVYYWDEDSFVRKSSGPNDRHGEIVYYVDGDFFVRKSSGPSDKYGAIVYYLERENRQKEYKRPANSNGGILLALAFVIAILLAPIIIVLGMFGKFLLKGLYKNVLQIEEFKKFRKTYTFVCFGWFVIGIASTALIFILLPDFAEYGLYPLFIGNIVLFALSIVFGNKIYKKNKDKSPIDSDVSSEGAFDDESLETEDDATYIDTNKPEEDSSVASGSNEYDNKKKKFELLAELAALRDANVLTEAEFNKQKQQILSANYESAPRAAATSAPKIREVSLSDENYYNEKTYSQKTSAHQENKPQKTKKVGRAVGIVCAVLLVVGIAAGVLIFILQHEHSFTSEIVSPTCENEGYTKYVCNCGYWYTNDISATGHSIENGICINCDYSELKYELSESGDSYIFSGGASGGDVVIPSEYNGLPVTGIACAFKDCTSLTSIIIPDSVTNIGAHAFYGCTSLTSITIPESVTSIADCAFKDCTSLTSIIIPDSVISIGASAFLGCTGLISITISESVVSIGDHAFADLFALEEINFNAKAAEDVGFSDNIFSNAGKDTDGVKVTIGVSVTKIPANMFAWYAHSSGSPLNVNSIEFVAGSVCTDIRNNAFADCDSITSITIPNGIISIGERAFHSCDALTDVVIPDSVTDVDYYAFYECNSLTNVTCPAVAANCISTASLKTVVITSGDEIADYSFNDCKSLISVKLPDTITKIGTAAFRGCENLTNVSLPHSITSIADYAFFECDLLTSISVDENNANYKDIDGNLYSKDGKILIQYAIGKTQTEFIIPNGVIRIGDNAFEGCSSLTSVTIPESVTSIANNAFSRCYRLVEVYNKSNLEITECNCALNIYTDANGSKLTTDNNGFIIYTDGSDKILIGYIGDKTDLTLPNGITAINDYAFESCASLTSIVIPDSVTSIGYEAFMYCSSLTSVIIPDSVEYIDYYAFIYCYSLTIYCEADVEPSGWNVFWNYSYCDVVWGYEISEEN